MLALKDIQYGIIPFGPANGNRALQIELCEKDDIEDYNIINDIETIAEAAGIKDAWISALDGTHTTFIVFTGGIIEQEKFEKEWNEFNVELSRKALNTQKGLRRVDQMRPPFCIFCGKPNVFSSKRQFYQYFNCIYAIIKDNDYNQMATQEMINHQFSNICLIAYPNYKDTIKQLKSTFNLANKMVVINDGKVQRNELMKYCLDNGYKYQINSDAVNEWYLELI